MRHITFKEMLETVVADILENRYSKRYFWRNGDDEYHEIIEFDLFQGRFWTDDRDFSEFEWEMKESRIYVEE